jgi:hypothetical protein
MRSTASRHVPVLAKSSGADSTMNPVPSRRVRAGSIGRALNAAKLVVLLFPALLGSGEKGEEGDAVLESRRDRRAAVDGVRESGGGLRFAAKACVVVVLFGVSVDGGDRVPADFKLLFVLGEAADVGDRALEVGGWLGNVLDRGESGLGLVGEVEARGPRVNLLALFGEARGPLGEDGTSTLLRRE